jgi:outer membrane protein assembly factor BamB
MVRCLIAASLGIALLVNMAGAVEPPQLGTRKLGDDWPLLLGPTGDNRSRETGIITEWNATSPKIVWQLPLGTGYGTPAISRGRLFQFHRVADQARLVCLNSETGAELWKFEYPSDYQDLYGYDNGPRSSPIVDEDRVYILGAEGMLHCLSVLDGKVIWKLDTTKQFGVIQNFFGVGCTPVIYEQLLILNIGGSPAESKNAPPGALDQVKGNGSGVVAFDKLTGQVKYQFSDELASYASPTLAKIDGRPWCFVFARGGLIGFDPATGKQDFHFPWRAEILESVNASNPVVFGDEVLISETYGPGAALLKVKPGSHSVVWTDEERRREKSIQTHMNTPIYHDGYVYASSGRHTQNAELRCVEWKTGKIMWSRPGLSRSSLLYVQGHFICLTEYGDLILLKATHEKFEPIGHLVLTGEKDAAGQPQRLLKYPAWGAPVLSHGLLYVRGADRLVCLDLIPEKK